MSRTLAVLLILTVFWSCKKQRVIHPVKRTIVQTVYASGKILADSEYTLYALNPGTVVHKLVREGERVKKDQVIYILRHTAPAVKLEAANSTLANARQNLSAGSRILSDLKIAEQNAQLKFSNDSLLYVRYQNLWAQNIGTRINLDNARTQYELSANLKKSAHEKYLATRNDLQLAIKNSQSLVAGSRSELDNYFIRAESSGTVYQLLKEQGEAVKMNEPVALLGGSAVRVIRLAVDQQDIAQLRIGQTLLLKTDVSGERIFKARICRIYPVMNEADQTFRVDASFDGVTDPAYIHSSVEANIIIARKPNCLTLPLAALLNGDSVLVRENGRIMSRPVKTGIQAGNQVEILGGISEHSEVIDPSNH